MTTPFDVWKGMITSSMNRARSSRRPGCARYCLSSYNIGSIVEPGRQTSWQDLDHVAVLHRVVAADALALEPSRRPPDARAPEAVAERPVDLCGHVGDGR